MVEDPRQKPTFMVRVVGAPGVGKTALVEALIDFPHATDDDLARLEFVDADAVPGPRRCDATLWVVRGAPDEDAKTRAAALGAPPQSLFVAVHARDVDREHDDEVREAWGHILDAERVYLTAAPQTGSI